MYNRHKAYYVVNADSNVPENDDNVIFETKVVIIGLMKILSAVNRM
jgi:hypothetical protein